MVTGVEQRPASTYGNFVKPASPGVAGLGLIGTGGLFVSMVLAMGTQMLFGFVAGLAVAVVCLLLLAPMLIRTREGRNGWQWLLARAAHKKATTAGATVYAPSLTQPLLFAGTNRLPGLLAKSRLVEHTDQHGKPFGCIIIDGATQHYSVMIGVNPEGIQLVDESQIDVWVAGWGECLRVLGDEPGFVGASVTVEAATDDGHSLAAGLEAKLAEGAPSMAVAAMRESVRRFPEGAADITAWVTLTWSGFRKGRKRKEHDVLDQIGHRLPSFTRSLRAAGAGGSAPMTAAQVAIRVRTAYDPSSAPTISQAGLQAHDILIPWEECGEPAATFDDRYEHAGACSVTWRMTEHSMTAVRATVLTPLLTSHPELMRKRLTLLYRPYSSSQAPRVIDEDIKTAGGQVSAAKRPPAAARRALASAEQAANEQAAGAGLERFAALVTVTTSRDELERAESLVDELAAPTRMTLRRVTYGQDVAFQAALGVGLVLSSHSRVPASVREKM